MIKEFGIGEIAVNDGSEKKHFKGFFCSDSAGAFVSIYRSIMDNTAEFLKKAPKFHIDAVLP